MMFGFRRGSMLLPTCLGLALALVLALCARPAWAGHYTVTYSGGTASWENHGGPRSEPYRLSPYGGGYGGGTLYAEWGPEWKPDGTKMLRNGNLKCSGTITATFTWQPNDPEDLPPTAAVVAQTCDARWSGKGDPGAGPTMQSCTNGLGFDYVPGQGGYGPYPGGAGVSSGTLYKVQEEPGASFTVTCSPSVQMSGVGSLGPPEAGGSATGSVSYSANAQPLEVVLKAVSDWSDSCLTEPER